MKKSFRELMRMAEGEGVAQVAIDRGTPHDRLTGLVDGAPFELVISRNNLDAPHGHARARANIRREVARIRTEAQWQLAKKLVRDGKGANA